jgi:hypothetical protein
MSLRFFTFDERPELERLKGPLHEAWPKFMFHDPVAGACWNLLYERFGGFQHFLFDEDAEEIVAEVNSLPVHVDLDAMPDPGWDDVMERGTAALEEPTAVSAIQVMIAPDRQGAAQQALSRAHACECRAKGLLTSRRPGAAFLEGALPAGADRPIRRMDDRGGAALQPLAANSRAARRRARPSLLRVDDHHR